MIIHVQVACNPSNNVWEAQVNGLDGCVATGSSFEEVSHNIKIVALHAIAEKIYSGVYVAPGSVTFVIHGAPSNMRKVEPIITNGGPPPEVLADQEKRKKEKENGESTS